MKQCVYVDNCKTDQNIGTSHIRQHDVLDNKLPCSGNHTSNVLFICFRDHRILYQLDRTDEGKVL